MKNNCFRLMIILDLKMEIIVLDVGGQIFKTYRNTLIRIPYFRNMIECCEDLNEIFVDRSSHIFDHVLAYVIDPKYPFPTKYGYELDFYGISYDSDKLYSSDRLMLQEISKLSESMIKLNTK